MSELALPSPVLIDANVLIAMIDANAAPEKKDKVAYLIRQMEKAGGKMIVPMPAIAEYLVGADIAGVTVISKLEKRANVVLAPFDLRAAYECALLDRGALTSKDKKDGSGEPWQKIKIDRQIVAIGKVHGATLVISDDASVRSNALRAGMGAMAIDELPEPPGSGQQNLFDDAKARR